MNAPDTKLKDLIHVEKGIIPKNVCDYIISQIGSRDWNPHTWYNSTSNTMTSEETKELDVQGTTEELQALLNPYIIQMGAIYNEKVHYAGGGERTQQIMEKFSPVRFNRYSPGQIMRCHIDHIKSLFTPPERGIPILSMIINFNDTYEGGDLVFWDDYSPKLGAGDIIAWPSLFLYPHRVDEVTKGTRYSGVVWCY